MSGDGKGFFGRLRASLNRGGTTLAREIRSLLQGRPIDAALLEELEERLIGADVGVQASAEILADLKARVGRHELADADALLDALQGARARGLDVLLADTAGRLHSQAQLMAELGKIKRVLGRLDPAAPHEVLLVLDANQGQNALAQAEQFHAAIGVSGLVITKLDGSARGGIVVAIARKLALPIRFIGAGESSEDFGHFDAAAFAAALLEGSAVAVREAGSVA